MFFTCCSTLCHADWLIALLILTSSCAFPGRSEDVDPLLKELFSEIKTPPPKDRRDGQTSGDFDPGSGSNKAQSENMNDTAPSGPQGEGEAGSGDTSDKNQKDFGNGSNNSNAPSLPSNNSLHDNNAPLLPSNNSPPDIKAPRLSANSSSPQKELDAKAVAKNDDKPGSGASGDDAEGIKQDSGSGGDSELFSSGSDANVPEKTSSAGGPDEKSVKPSSQESAEETKTGNVAAEKDAAIASPGFASVSEQGVSAEVKNPDNQPVYTSDSAKANVNTAVTTSDLPAEKQETSVSTGQGEDITTDTSQSRNSQDFSERARGNIPDTPANTDLLTSTGNDAQQPSNSGKIILAVFVGLCLFVNERLNRKWTVEVSWSSLTRQTVMFD